MPALAGPSRGGLHRRLHVSTFEARLVQLEVTNCDLEFVGRTAVGAVRVYRAGRGDAFERAASRRAVAAAKAYRHPHFAGIHTQVYSPDITKGVLNAQPARCAVAPPRLSSSGGTNDQHQRPRHHE